LSGKPSPPFVHDARGPLIDLQMVAPPLKFIEEVAVFLRFGGAAVGNAALEVGIAVLADMLVASTEEALAIRGQFWKEGKDAALTIHAEDDACDFHCSVLSMDVTATATMEGENHGMLFSEQLLCWHNMTFFSQYERFSMASSTVPSK